MLRKIQFAVVSTFLFVVSASGQAFTFEGFNVILQAPQTHTTPTCALRYVSPQRDVIVTDLDQTTPMNIKSCSGRSESLTKRGAFQYAIRANVSDYKWCFQGEDEKYRIEFAGDSWAPRVQYVWSANTKVNDEGRYNVKDFGAKGDGRTDDTVSIQGALAFVASRNGGILKFPAGDYVVGGVQGFEGLTLPSGITLEGISGLQTGATTNNIKRENPSRITLTGTNRSLFRIGECTESVTMRDLELFSRSTDRTVGLEGTGAYISAQGFQLERMAFSNFFRGIQVIGLPQTNLGWQFDYVKIRDTRFLFNKDAGIYTNIRNSDWKIEGALFVNPKFGPNQNAMSFHFERVGMVLIEDSYAGGFPNALGGTFINMLDTGSLTVIGSQAEAVTKSFEYNGVQHPSAGDYSYPITFINNIFYEPIIFKARRTFVSTGSLYGPNTFQAGPDLRVYSTGDRFCYDGIILGCPGATVTNFDRATVVFMTGQPGEGALKGHPAYFGTDVEFGQTVKMQSFRQNALPGGKENGSMVYCEDCRRDTTPCRGGGSGAPAMVVSGSWSCL